MCSVCLSTGVHKIDGKQSESLTGGLLPKIPGCLRAFIFKLQGQVFVNLNVGLTNAALLIDACRERGGQTEIPFCKNFQDQPAVGKCRTNKTCRYNT